MDHRVLASVADPEPFFTYPTFQKVSDQEHQF
jgi:hypothetical protein